MTWCRVAATAVFGVLLLAGCTPVPSTVAGPTTGPARSPSPSPPPPVVQQPLQPPPVAQPLPALPSATGFDGAVAVTCGGRPGADRVVALLKSKGVLSGGGTVSVQVGPLCAGTWQYTVLAVSGREPLQVVTEGAPESLRLVAAGTDVCSAVRTQAPAGILSVAHCG